MSARRCDVVARCRDYAICYDATPRMTRRRAKHTPCCVERLDICASARMRYYVIIRLPPAIVRWFAAAADAVAFSPLLPLPLI